MILSHKEKQSSIVIICEIILTENFKPDKIYLIQDVNLKCELLEPTVLRNYQFLRIYESSKLESIMRLDFLLGRAILNDNNNVVATLFRYINTTTIAE